MKRKCGACTVCCTVTGVPELRKPEGLTCLYCNKGCSIYERRPESCQKFECAWLQGELPDFMRPDRVHVMIEKLPVVSVVLALPEPGHEKTWATKRVVEALQRRYQKRGIGVVTHQDGHRYALVPEGKTGEEVTQATNLGAALVLGAKVAS